MAGQLGATSQQDVIDRALETLEHKLFWEAFDEEAKEYLESFPAEAQERERFSRLSADGLSR